MELSSSISTRIQYQHKSLLELIEGLTDEQIRRQIIPGKWCIFENIVHLSTYQHVFMERLKRMMQEENPSLSRYTADSDPLFADNCSKSTREIMQDMITTRKEMTAVILSYKEAELTKTGEHPEFGEMTVAQWLNFFLLHEAHHLFTIFKLAAKLKKEY